MWNNTLFTAQVHHQTGKQNVKSEILQVVAMQITVVYYHGTVHFGG